MLITIKKLVKYARLPRYAHVDDGGADLFAADSGTFSTDYDYIEYGTGLAINIPKGYIGLVFPRSSISKTPHSLRNSIAVIDAGYRGEVKLRFSTNADKEYLEYKFGDAIGQLIVIPKLTLEFVEVEELPDSDRDTGGFGSTSESIDDIADNIMFEDETYE